MVANRFIQIALIALIAINFQLLSSGQQQTRPARASRQRKRSDGNDTTALLHEHEFISPQARVQMDCQQDRTLIRVNFTRPFNGIMGAGNSATKCKLVGGGDKYYQLEVYHNATQDCDARWDNSTSSIVNTLFIRFHQSLETGADIAKNVLCRLAVGNVVVGRRPTPLKKAPRSAKSVQIIRAPKLQVIHGEH